MSWGIKTKFFIAAIRCFSGASGRVFVVVVLIVLALGVRRAWANTPFFPTLSAVAPRGLFIEIAGARVIDGALSKDIMGTVASGGVSCAYRIHFEGRTPVEGERLQTANYATFFRCTRPPLNGAGPRKAEFFAHVFLGETPMEGTGGRRGGGRHQLTVDVLFLDADGVMGTDMVSTSFFYDPGAKRVSCDYGEANKGGDETKGQTTPCGASFPAPTVGEAVDGAVRHAMKTWGNAFWRRMFSSENGVVPGAN